MTEQRFDGIKIIRSTQLPVEIYNQKTKEKEVFHMIQSGDVLYVSEKLYNALIDNFKGDDNGRE